MEQVHVNVLLCVYTSICILAVVECHRLGQQYNTVPNVHTALAMLYNLLEAPFP